jgi:alkylation response protein AidB-like acyl-CoA dehydrogenase
MAGTSTYLQLSSYALVEYIYSTETIVTSKARTLRLYNGYTKEYPAEKFLRDAKLMTIGEGTSEIQKLVISREILK